MQAFLHRLARSLVVGCVVYAALSSVRLAHAGDLEDGLAAYKVGNYGTAIQLLLPLAQAGDPTALVAMGDIYTRGQGVFYDYDKALSFYGKAYTAGSYDALAETGNLYRNGYGVDQDYDKAAKMFQEASQHGSLRGESYLGEAYASGQGMPEDYQKAFDLFRDAATRGYVGALVNLGNLSLSGRGVAKDAAGAARYYQTAIDQYSPQGMNNLGLMWQKGLGLPKDPQGALGLFQKAGLQGESSGAYNAGWAFENGIGTDRDLVQAFKWYEIGASEGGKLSAHRRDLLAMQLSAGEIQQARQQEPQEADFGGQIKDKLLRLICAANDIVQRSCKSAIGYPGYAGPCSVSLGSDVLSGQFISEKMLLLVPYGSNCEPHANSWGGVIIAEVVSGDIEFRQYLPGYLANSDCVPFHQSHSIDELFCVNGFMGTGDLSSVLVQMSFSVDNGRYQIYEKKIMAGDDDSGEFGKPAIDCRNHIHYLSIDNLRVGSASRTLEFDVSYADEKMIREACSSTTAPLTAAVIAPPSGYALLNAEALTARYVYSPDAGTLRDETNGQLVSVPQADDNGQSDSNSSGDGTNSAQPLFAAPQISAATTSLPPSKPKIVATGSGFYVSNASLLLTNYHVVEGCKSVTIPGAAASVVGVDPQNDLALLSAPPRSGGVAALRASPAVRSGVRVVAVGFPLTGFLASQANVTEGNVSATAGINDDSRYLQITAPVQPGNSGGPLLDLSGNVIGVVSAKLDAIKIAGVTGDIPENVNFALNVSVIRAFLDSRGVAYQTAASAAEHSEPDIGDWGKSITELVECWK